MSGLLNFDEKTERKHLSSIFKLMLDRSFDGGSEFDHMFMSAGEDFGRILEHLGAVSWEGSSIILKMSEEDILKKIEESPIVALPALTDIVDVLLTFLGQYASLPKLTNPFRYAEFDFGVAPILKEMRLLDSQHVADRSFWLFLIDHYSILPDLGGWNDNVRDELRNVCDITWADGPEEFRAVFEGRSDRPVTWAEGYMRNHWRHGHWLTVQEEARSITQGHSFLPMIVCNTLMNENREVYVPPKFLQEA